MPFSDPVLHDIETHLPTWQTVLVQSAPDAHAAPSAQSVPLAAPHMAPPSFAWVAPEPALDAVPPPLLAPEFEPDPEPELLDVSEPAPAPEQLTPLAADARATIRTCQTRRCIAVFSRRDAQPHRP
jgi:hypothetical protein